MAFRNPLSLRNISDLFTYPSGEETKVQPGKECAWGHTARAASLIPRFLTAAGAGAAAPEDLAPFENQDNWWHWKKQKTKQGLKESGKEATKDTKMQIAFGITYLKHQTFQEFLNFSSISYILRNPTACLAESILRYVRRQY